MNKQEIEQLISELENNNWICKYGLVHTAPCGPDKEPGTLNGVLYTGLLVGLIHESLEQNKIPLDGDIKRFLNKSVNAIMNCGIGVYPMVKRTPTNFDQQGPDDYKGLSAMLAAEGMAAWADVLYDPTIAQFKQEEFQMRLRPWLPKLNRWMNNTNDKDKKFEKLPDGSTFLEKLKYLPFAPWGHKPWLKPWMGRFPALTFAWEVTSGRRPSFISTAFAFASILQQALFGNNKKPDSWYMDKTILLNNHFAESPSKLIKLITPLWEKRFLKLYPNGMRDVFKRYVGAYGDVHPFAKYL